jgi:hypothetical protein
MVPVPQVSTIAELNALLDVWDQEDEERRIADRTRTVGEFFAIERPLLARLPQEAFETGRILTPRVDRYAQVTVRMNRYSVPMRLIGRQVRVLLHASDLVVYDGRAEVARHERLGARGGSRLELDHYLEGLLRKPGALPGATVLEQARAAGRFTPVHAGSPRSMTPGGRPRARRTGTRPAPGPWSRCCCCTGGWPTSTSSPGSRLRCGPGR